MMPLFNIPIRIPGLPPAVPVYDVSLTHGGTRVAAVGPYYSRTGWWYAELFIDGRKTTHWVDEDPEHFCSIIYADVPPESIRADSIAVEVRLRGKTLWEGPVSRVIHPTGTVSIATLARYDWPWIGEWIEHHRGLGVEHFYIYNNGENRLSEAIRLYGSVVTEIAWPGPYVLYDWSWDPFWPTDCHWNLQPAQQVHAALKYGDQWTWMGFFDADEFLVIPRGRNLQEILEPAQWKGDRPLARVGALRVQGRWFGNSGHHERPEGMIRTNYLHCEKGMTSPTKEFIRPRAARSSRIHWWTVDGETVLVDPLLVRFNHYRGISDHNVRRSASYDREFSNECTDEQIMEWL